MDNRITEEDVIRTIGAFAEATIDPGLLPDALVQIAELIGAVSCAMEFADLGTGEASLECPFPFEDETLRLYEERIFHINPRVTNALAAPVGRLVDDRHLLPQEDPNTPEFLDWLARTPSRYMQGARLLGEGGQVAFYGAHFSRRQGPHEDWQSRINQVLVPHLINFLHAGRALSEKKLRNRLTSERDLNGGRSFALLDRLGGIVETSKGFEETFRASGLLICRERKIAATFARHRHQVELFLKSALDERSRLEPPRPVRLASPDRPRGIVLRAVPLPPRGNLFDVFMPAALITLTDLDQPWRVCRAELMALFDLTGREAEMAALIGEGHTIEQAARIASISPHTAKQHLKAVFGKIGISRQAELVAIVARLA